METVKGGLTLYAYFKTYGMIFLGIILLLSGAGFLFKIIIGNYQKSPSSKIDYYTITDLTECTDYEITNNLCKLQLVYSDGTNIYKNNTDPNSKVGETTVFYEQKNPKSYLVTPSPYIFPGMLSIISCVVLTIAIMRLMLIKSNPDNAAIIGGIDVASEILSSIQKN